MRSSTIVLVACLIAIAGFALADALRDENDANPPAEPEATTRQKEAAFEGTLPPDVLTGRLVFTDRNCDLGVADLARAVVVHVRDVETNCVLAAPVRSRRIAYGFGPLGRETLSYRVTNFSRPEQTLARLRARPGSIVWSRDGERVAWCSRGGRGYELEIGARKRPLAFCPVAYTRKGEPVRSDGPRLLAGSRALIPPMPGRITAASIGADRSVAVVLEGKRIVLVESAEIRIPTRVRNVVPAFSPDNCGAILLTPHRGQPPGIIVLDICGGHDPVRHLSGLRAVWSPDGRWLAVAEERTIAFYPLDERGSVFRLPGIANQIVWQR